MEWKGCCGRREDEGGEEEAWDVVTQGPKLTEIPCEFPKPNNY